MLPGDNWAEAAGVALGDSEAMVTLVTPRSAGSAQLKMETGFALMNRNYERRVVPLVVGERTALPPDAFPWILEQYGVVDLPDESDLERAMDRVADHMREPDFAPSEMAAPAASAATALA